MRKLLYVEDDTVIRNNFSELFLSMGYNVHAVDSQKKASELIQSRSDFSGAVIDVELRDDPFAGIQLCAQFREKFPSSPILILSSYTDSDLQETAYKIGADVYLDKREPLSLISIKLHSLFVRYDMLSQESSASDGKASDSDSLSMNDAAEILSWKGHKVELNPTRFKILRELYRDFGSAVSIYDIQDRLNIVVEANTIVQHVKAIRDAFTEVDPAFDCIQTVRGKGYRWIEE